MKQVDISNLAKYDSMSERLPDNATAAERFIKFAKIFEELNKNGIHVVDVTGSPTMEDKECNFRLTHNIISWEIFRVEDVIDMIVSARDIHKEAWKKI